MLEENTQPQVEEEVVVNEENEVETNEEPKQAFKVKYLHEEKEVPFEEAEEWIQKGMNYDRVKEKYESSKVANEFLSNEARKHGLSVDDYIKAVNENQRQQQVNDLADRYSMEPELAEELYLLREERKTRAQREQEFQAKEKENQDYINFFKEFPDVSAESIPTEVFELKAKNPNMSLVDAYIRNEYNALKNKNKTAEVNDSNANSSTGSVTGNGESKTNYITKDAFEKNRGNKDWVRKNYEKLVKSRAKW